MGLKVLIIIILFSPQMLVVYQPLSVLIALTSQTCHELCSLSLHLFQFSCPLLRVTILLPFM